MYITIAAHSMLSPAGSWSTICSINGLTAFEISRETGSSDKLELIQQGRPAGLWVDHYVEIVEFTMKSRK